MSSTLQLLFASTTPRNESLHEGSRSVSKLSLNGLVDRKQQTRTQNGETFNDEEDVSNKSIIAATAVAGSSDSGSSGNNDMSSSESDIYLGLLTSGDEDDDSDYESVPWSEGGDIEDEEPGCGLFVVC